MRQFGAVNPTPLADLLPTLGTEGIRLLEQMLQWVPESRITAEAALHHRYFDGI